MTSGFSAFSRRAIAAMRAAGIHGSTAWISVKMPIFKGFADFGQSGWAMAHCLTARLKPGSIANASAAPNTPEPAVAAPSVRNCLREIMRYQ